MQWDQNDTGSKDTEVKTRLSALDVGSVLFELVFLFIFVKSLFPPHWIYIERENVYYWDDSKLQLADIKG